MTSMHSDSQERLDQIIHAAGKATSLDSLEASLKDGLGGVLLGLGAQWWRSSPRNAVPDALTVFDFAEPSAVNGHRDVTTVPSQALYLLNNDFVAAQARRFAERLSAVDEGKRIDMAFQLAFSRKPSANEVQAAQSFFTGYPKSESAGSALTSFCRALLGSAEFRSVD